MIISFCVHILLRILKYLLVLIYANTSTSTHSDIIYKFEGSSKDDDDKGGNDNNDGSSKDDGDKGGNDNNDGANEEESFEIEEEIAHIERIMWDSNNAMILDEKLPDSQKEKNSHLNALRKDPDVKEFFEGKTLDVRDLPELNKALVEAREEKLKELAEAKKYAKDEWSTNSLRDKSNSSLHESDNTLNKEDYALNKEENTLNKEDNDNYLDYKLLPSLLDYIIEILNNFF